MKLFDDMFHNGAEGAIVKFYAANPILRNQRKCDAKPAPYDACWEYCTPYSQQVLSTSLEMAG